MEKAIVCLAAFMLAGCASKAVDADVALISGRSQEQTVYFVFDRDNSRSGQQILPTTSSVNTFRNFRSKTVVIFHDHEGSGTTTLNPILKDAFLQSEDVTVIIVDWSHLARQSYLNAVVGARAVGEEVAELIRLLVARNLVNVSRLHLVGFGLGAHLSAFTARAINGVVGRITGLDPAGQLWGAGSAHLTSADAAYVEVIHTDGVNPSESGNANGIGMPIGHVDFFPNGGTAQPGCADNHVCNHRRAWEFFAASLTHSSSLVGHRCEESTLSEAGCTGYSLALGNNENVKYGTGVFYLRTTTVYPFN